ncbi:MAG TPA: ABC transporter transmembrane domain-containing protein, partial [Trebonia sp.]|nr:ABC transporter transmembrane domain-containing protein [Trebonia sp.]
PQPGAAVHPGRRHGGRPDRQRRHRDPADLRDDQGRAARHAGPGDQLYSHLETLSLAFFTGTKTGEIQSRLANDVGGVQTVVTTTASTILANVVIFVSTIVAMIILSWQQHGLYAALYNEQFEGGRVQWRCDGGDVMEDGSVRKRETLPA